MGNVTLMQLDVLYVMNDLKLLNSVSEHFGKNRLYSRNHIHNLEDLLDVKLMSKSSRPNRLFNTRQLKLLLELKERITKSIREIDAKSMAFRKPGYHRDFFKTFVDLVDTGSINQFAKDKGITPQSVYNRLGRVRELVNDDIYGIKCGVFCLTPVGFRTYEIFRDIANDIDQTVKMIKDL